MARTVVHFAPHPDDELLGAPGALLALRDAGWRVVNVACSLGRPEQHERRLAELREACARAGLELWLEPAEPAAVLAELRPELVVAPSPHDRHPFHEQVGRDVLAAAARYDEAVVWLWSLWGESPLPSLAVDLTRARVEEIAGALAAHAGELARADFARLLEGRAAANAVLGAERTFGFGVPQLPYRYAELLTEVRLIDGRWHLAEPRAVAATDTLDPDDGRAGALDVTDWLAEPSITARFGRPGK